MKRLNFARSLLLTLLLIAGLAMAVLMGGCDTIGSKPASGSTASTAATPNNLTFAQTVAIVCPPLQSALATGVSIIGTLATTSPNYARAQADLAKAQPIVSAACAAGATINSANLSDLAATALPAISDLVGSLNLSSKEQSEVQAGLLAAQVALGLVNVVESNIAAAQAAANAPPAAVSTSASH